MRRAQASSLLPVRLQRTSVRLVSRPQSAVAACDERALETHSHLDPASRALLSQAGPHSGRALTVFPTLSAVALPPAHLRVLLDARRLPRPLPLSLAPRTCRCRGHLEFLGDHRSAYATFGVLASRALPLEHAVAPVCREGGARVARNVRVADMNIDVPVSDAHCIEVVANGLPLPSETYPELASARRARLVVVVGIVGAALVCAGPASSQSRPCAHTPRPSLGYRMEATCAMQELRPTCTRSSLRSGT